MFENNYYSWTSVKANRWGLTHIFKDKRKGQSWLVHVTGYRFPIKNCKAILRFCM